MKKIVALALALVLALSLGSVAFAAPTPDPDKQLILDNTINADANGNYVNFGVVYNAKPGDVIELVKADWDHDDVLKGYKIDKVDFTTEDLCGASLIENVKITKEKNAISLTVKESYTMALDEAKPIKGVIKYLDANKVDWYIYVNLTVNNTVVDIAGSKKAADAEDITAKMGKNIVLVNEDGGYVKFTEDVLTGVVKMNKDEKVYLNVIQNDKDVKEEIEEYLGEDYDATVEYYTFETRAFKNTVDFTYEAYEEDDHFFYVWDGEKLTALDAKYDDDEDVEAYVWTAAAEGTIVVTDVEVVAAAEEETKNPDTGANDVVGVAAALAVVSLVAAGAVALKK